MGLLLFSEKNQLCGTQAIHFAVAMLCERLKTLQQLTETHASSVWRNGRAARSIASSPEALSPEHRSLTSQDFAVFQSATSPRCSKSIMGTFRKLLLMERVARAMRRLRASEDSLPEIALDCSFTDQSCFTR